MEVQTGVSRKLLQILTVFIFLGYVPLLESVYKSIFFPASARAQTVSNKMNERKKKFNCFLLIIMGHDMIFMDISSSNHIICSTSSLVYFTCKRDS